MCYAFALLSTDGGDWGATAEPAASATDIERLLEKREAVAEQAEAAAAAPKAAQPPTVASASGASPPAVSPAAVPPAEPPADADAGHPRHPETTLDIIPEPWAADDDLSHERGLLEAYQQRENRKNGGSSDGGAGVVCR